MNYKKGYTLLFSIIVASIVLSIAAFILSISRKQFILSTTSRDSTVAVYAADTGIQCAVEAYLKGNLATTTLSPTIVCNGASSLPSSYNLSATPDLDMGLISGSTYYKVEQLNSPITFLFPSNKTCVIINVTQGYYKEGENYIHKTIIDSRGYNDSDSKPCLTGGPTNQRALERAIRHEFRG